MLGSRIIHYCVGNEILKRVAVDEQQFMLGNLAPDAYNPNNGGSLLSHFRIPEDIMEDECVDFDKFINKYGTSISDPFVLGYYSHLITDNLWLKDAFRKYGHMNPDERNAAVKLIYSDYWVLNNILISKYQLEMRGFRISDNVPIDEIEIDFLNALLENLRNDFQKRDTSTILRELRLEEILDFIENAVSECVRSMNILRNK